MLLKKSLSVFFLFSFTIAIAQKPNPSLAIKKAKGTIVIDGELNETDWYFAETAGNFYQNFPADTLYSTTKTEVKVTYDDHAIYVSALCFDDLPGKFVVQSLKRDFSYPVSDAFAVYIDPFNDKTNGFCFGVNPYGVQREGLIQFGGGDGVTTAWDNKWESKVVIKEGVWIVEMAIPFKSIRYNANVTEWGINFSRNDLKRNENSSWATVPRNFNSATLAYTGTLQWDNPPKKAGANVSIIPYAIAGYNDNYQTKSIGNKGYNVGGDAKIAITSSLNLDVTINPDFSQVEVDQQVTNLSQFSLFYPEKRQFFIENSDLFDRFGFRQIRPFFSRTIGLAFDASTSSMQPVPILGGLRLSGKINKNWRVGLMNMQTGKSKKFNTNPQNYTTIAFQRQIFSRSNVAAIFVNRQGFTDNEINTGNFNRLAGLDFNYASADNKWQGKAFYHHTFSPQQKQNSQSNATWLMYNSRNILAMWNHEYVDKDFEAEVGFVPRNRIFNPKKGAYDRISYWRLEPMLYYTFYPKKGKLISHRPGIYFSQYFGNDYKTYDYLLQASYVVLFRNNASIEVNANTNLSTLFFDRDVSFTGKKPLPAGAYTFNNGSVGFQSNKRSVFSYSLSLDYGDYYVGKRLGYYGELNFRTQPWGIFSLTYSRNEIRLPDPYSNAYISLIGPKFDISFSKSIFFTTFLQYNTQVDNFNINSRIQWRFKPMSDFFIVYTDNYDSNLKAKNRALVVKLVWWLSV